MMFTCPTTRRTVAVSFLACLGALLCSILGCQAPSRKVWEIAFSTDTGCVVLATYSTEALFAGRKKPIEERKLYTQSFCRWVWSDPTSGRLATVETNGVERIRVYDSACKPIAEYVAEAGARGWLYSIPVLSKGGRRVAFCENGGTVRVAEVTSEGLKDVRTVATLRLPPELEDPRWAKQVALSRLDHLDRDFKCRWLSDGELVVGIRTETYLIDVSDKSVTPMRERMLIDSTTNSFVVQPAPSKSCAYDLRDGRTGEALGGVFAGHAYGRVLAVSPCGEYVLCTVAARWLVFPGYRFVQNVRTGRRAEVGAPGAWLVGSWSEAMRCPPAAAGRFSPQTTSASQTSWPAELAGRPLRSGSEACAVYASDAADGGALAAWITDELAAFGQQFRCAVGPGVVIAIDTSEDPIPLIQQWWSTDPGGKQGTDRYAAAGPPATGANSALPYAMGIRPYFRESFMVRRGMWGPVLSYPEHARQPAWLCFLVTDSYFDRSFDLAQRQQNASDRLTPSNPANKPYELLMRATLVWVYGAFRAVDLRLMHLQRHEVLWRSLLETVEISDSDRASAIAALRSTTERRWNQIYERRPID